MRKLRQQFNWQTTIAPLVFGTAIVLVIASCSGQVPNPAGPSGVGNQRDGSGVQGVVNLDGIAAIDDPTPPPTPPKGGEGCTPGYWKQSQHFDSWTAPYTPGTPFSSVFEDAFPGMTLLQVLELGGGGLNALGRHTVAALLSGASGGVDYDLTAQEVIDRFNSVFPGGDYETLKNRLDFLNNQGCPLN